MFKIIEETYNWKPGSAFKPQTPDTLVIHHALSRNCTAQDVHKWHLANDWKGIAYHFFVRKDGTIYRGRQEHHVGGHLLDNENNNTIGICLEGCYTDYIVKGEVWTEKIVPEVQLDALIWLVQDCKSRWPINNTNGHRDYASAQKEEKDCPGKYFPWDSFIQKLKTEEHKRIIQAQVGFSNPQRVWEAIETHPYSDALLMQWAKSYNRTPG